MAKFIWAVSVEEKTKRNGRKNRENINVGPDCKTVRSMSNWKNFDENFWAESIF